MTREGSDMQRDREYRDRRNAQTRACHAANKKEDVNEGRRPRSLAQRILQRWRRLQRCYGLSREDYEALLADQGGACGICKQPPAEPLVVDRSRATGRVRGLLCRRCKAGLVCFEEDPRLLMRASAYREKTVPDHEP
jgi:hypothetical protein